MQNEVHVSAMKGPNTFRRRHPFDRPLFKPKKALFVSVSVIKSTSMSSVCKSSRISISLFTSPLRTFLRQMYTKHALCSGCTEKVRNLLQNFAKNFFLSLHQNAG